MSDVTLDNYVENAVRTESVVANEFDMNSRVLHAFMGLTTETGELFDALKRHIFYVKENGERKDLDYVNLCEEVGDLMWYMAILCDHYGVSFKRSVEICRLTQLGANFKLDFLFSCLLSFQTEVSNEFSQYYKAKTDYGNELHKNDRKQHPDILKLFTALSNVIVFLPQDWEEIAQVNINKLRARFPEKYETSKAYDRDLDKERQILEDGHNN